MKLKPVFSIVIFISLCLVSCSKNDLNFNEFPQVWKLVKMTSSWSGDGLTGSKMSWQEYYVFHASGQFDKKRTTDVEYLEASGTYTIENKDGKTVYLLTYETGENINVNCSPTDIEELITNYKENRLYNNWGACDGADLEYQMQASH